MSFQYTPDSKLCAPLKLPCWRFPSSRPNNSSPAKTGLICSMGKTSPAGRKKPATPLMPPKTVASSAPCTRPAVARTAFVHDEKLRQFYPRDGDVPTPRVNTGLARAARVCGQNQFRQCGKAKLSRCPKDLSTATRWKSTPTSKAKHLRAASTTSIAAGITSIPMTARRVRMEWRSPR